MSGFDLGSCINSLTEWCCSASIIRNTIDNPIFCTLLLVTLISVVLLYLYKYQIKLCGSKKAIKAIIYISIITLIILSLHFYCISYEISKSLSKKEVSEVFNDVENIQNLHKDDTTKVVPRIDEL